ncbi:EAL domain-containing protein [Nitrincola schmidtii]|uniref:two-component system response regulator n=1 Tax=Nitrincola schmidtii TaxID=1730894 RepID=UPI00124DB01F|nr:EAL domain-containing protein [Nitrincola schmidtii]
MTKILIVDDAKIERFKIVSFFSKLDFFVIEASDGKDGIDKFLSNQPDLVLMDANMPVLNGYDAIRIIREHEVTMVTPILMLTADDDLSAIEQAFEAGANDFFPKPINFPLLHQRIRYALRDATRERELMRITGLQETARILAGLAFWEIDMTNQQMRWSDDANNLLHWIGTLPNTFEGGMQIIHPDDRQRMIHVFEDAAKTGAKFELEVRSPAQKQDRILKIVGQINKVQKLFVGAIQDVTSQRRLEQQVNYLAFHDAITGLPNRKLFLRDLEESLELASVKNARIVVGVLELVRFQQISETYGVEVADQLLIRLVSQLRGELLPNTLIARMDGGVFVWRTLLDNDSDDEHISAEINSWLAQLNRSWVLGDRETYLTFTAGISIGPDHSGLASELFSMAHRTQRLQKPTANVTLGFYTDRKDEGLQNRLKMESDLRVAVAEKQFYLVYQPQIELSSDRVVGVEALLRWRHPQGESVAPFRFIPILEEMGLISELGDWIIEEACRQQVQWTAEGYPLRMGVNLSPVQFDQANLPSKIQAIVTKTMIEPHQLELEITESLAMHNPEETIETLQQLRKLGFKIAIDDFGIGFSSLEYLLRFPLDTLKIDRAFVKDITQGRSDRAIVRALTSLCQGLGLTTIAEGVETQRQRDYIDALGATEIQGYLISPPLEPEVLINLINSLPKGLEAL